MQLLIKNGTQSIQFVQYKHALACSVPACFFLYVFSTKLKIYSQIVNLSCLVQCSQYSSACQRTSRLYIVLMEWQKLKSFRTANTLWFVYRLKGRGICTGTKFTDTVCTSDKLTYTITGCAGMVRSTWVTEKLMYLIDCAGNYDITGSRYGRAE